MTGAPLPLLTRGVGKLRRVRVFLPRMLVLLSRFSFLHVFEPLLRRLLRLGRDAGASRISRLVPFSLF